MVSLRIAKVEIATNDLAWLQAFLKEVTTMIATHPDITAEIDIKRAEEV